MRGVNQLNSVSRTRSGLGLTSGTSATGMSARRHLPPMTLTEPGGINALAMPAGGRRFERRGGGARRGFFRPDGNGNEPAGPCGV